MPMTVCVKCGIEIRCETNEVAWLSPGGGCPDQLWQADLWKCPGCGHTVLQGFGAQPMSHSNEPGFQSHVDYYHRLGRLHKEADPLDVSP